MIESPLSARSRNSRSGEARQFVPTIVNGSPTPDALIDNPIPNSPFASPARHFQFTDEGISNETVDALPGQDHQYRADFQCRLSRRESVSPQSLARWEKD